MSDHQKNQEIFLKISSKISWSNHCFTERKMKMKRGEINYLPNSTQLINRRPQYWSADSKTSFPSTMTFSDGVLLGLPAKHCSQPVSTFTYLVFNHSQHRWKWLLMHGERANHPHLWVYAMSQRNHCCKELSIPSKKEKKLSLNDNTDTCGEFISTILYFLCAIRFSDPCPRICGMATLLVTWSKSNY